ncbi:hypothetical protein EYF80_067056 [Liparis tanakae]|uniref:Uncharacterized protein n=1 Tax=Liparis tanakae TaxID=230148 RepID=A0A4Z2E256_9TELE|nr:hypothetical protein EYF80_067056 [Liparis tanakae]
MPVWRVGPALRVREVCYCVWTNLLLQGIHPERQTRKYNECHPLTSPGEDGMRTSSRPEDEVLILLR